MHALKIVLLVAAAASIPVVTTLLIRFLLKVSRGLDHINRTLDDARPQLNLLLSHLNQAMEEINGELERVGQMTGEAQEMLKLTESSLHAVERALRSPWARFAAMLAGFTTTSLLLHGVRRKIAPKRKRA